MPESTGKLAEALAAFQAEAPSVAKDKTAKVPMKSGGQYSYAYADLADVAAAAYPILSRHGLSFSCCPRRAEYGWEVVGRLMHSGGESLEGSLPLNGNSPQELGSSITYARRYLLGSMTGIVTDADDDGALAQGASRAKPKPVPAKPEPQPEPAAETGEAMTARTRGQLFALFTEHHIPEASQRAGISNIIGRQITSRADITEAEALRVIADLKARPKPRPEGEH